MPTPFRDPDYRAQVRAARADPEYHNRQLAFLRDYLERVTQIIKPLADFRYSSLYALVLDQGQPFLGAPRPKGLRKMTNRLCFQNAVYLVMDDKSLRYFEGFAVSSSGIPCEHAWVVRPDGTAIDPTWYDPDLAVYLGIEIPWAFVGQRISRQHRFGVLVNDWLHGYAVLRTGRFELDERRNGD